MEQDKLPIALVCGVCFGRFPTENGQHEQKDGTPHARLGSNDEDEDHSEDEDQLGWSKGRSARGMAMPAATTCCSTSTLAIILMLTTVS